MAAWAKPTSQRALGIVQRTFKFNLQQDHIKMFVVLFLFNDLFLFKDLFLFLFLALSLFQFQFQFFLFSFGSFSY